MFTDRLSYAGVDMGRFADEEWIVTKDKDRYDQTFFSLGPRDGKIAGAAAKSEMVRSLYLLSGYC